MRAIRTSICLIVLLVVTTRAAPEVTRAEYSVVDTTLLDYHYQHAIFDLEFDEELYYPENWPCSCTTAGQSQCSGKTLSPVSVPAYAVQAGVTELQPVHVAAGSDSTQMDDDGWIEDIVSYGEYRYYYFDLNEGDYSGCPIVSLDLFTNVGSVSLYASTAEFPDANNHIWGKISYQKEGWWVCPNMPGWGWGRWYIAVAQGPPPKAYNQYKIRVRTMDSTVCNPTPPAVDHSPAPGDDWILLEDSVAYQGEFEWYVYKWFRFYTDSQCSDFAISARQYNTSVEGDLDLYVSTSITQPTLETDYEWASHIDDDDRIVVLGLCVGDLPTLPDSNGNLVFYIGSYTWSGDTPEGLITATRSATMLFRPVTRLSPTQLVYSVATGAVRLHCGSQGEEVLKCEFPASEGCSDPSDQFQCCDIFYPVMTADTSDRSNHIFPKIDSKVSTNWMNDLYFNLTLDSSEAHPRRLRYSVLISERSVAENIYRQHLLVNPSTCEIEFRHFFSNSAGEPVQGRHTFRLHVPESCDEASLQSLKDDYDRLLTLYQQETDLQELRLIHTKIVFLTTSRVWQDCKQLLRGYVRTLPQQELYPEQETCFALRYSPEYQADACCTTLPSFNSCCVPRDRIYQSMSPYEADFGAISEQCAAPLCTLQAVSTYASSDSFSQCSSRWSERAGRSAQRKLLAGVQECRNSLFGLRNNDGLPCVADTDCDVLGYSAPCVQGICGYTDDDLLDCWVSRIAGELGQLLFHHWNLPEEATPARLAAEIQSRTEQTLCNGPESIRFRPHWHYLRDIPDCVDDCFDPSRGIDIEPRCYGSFSEENCPVPDACVTEGISSLFCIRTWTYVTEAAPGCEDELECSWTPCNMTAELEAPSTGNVCVLCLGNQCEEVPFSSTSAECNEGVCVLETSTGRTLLPASDCSTAAYCTQDCGGTPCSSRTACEATGYCENLWTVSACFSPFVPDFYGDPYCAEPGWPEWWYLEPESNYGCLENVASEAECTAAGYQWITHRTTQAECEAAGSQCYCEDCGWLDVAGAYTTMSQAECDRCGNTWRPTSVWRPGEWVEGTVLSTEWIPRSVDSVRQLQQRLDAALFESELEAAVARSTALAYREYDNCLVEAELTAMQDVACGCGGSGNCQRGDLAVPVSLDRACALVASNFTYLHVSAQTVPLAEFCIDILVEKYDKSQFATQQTAVVQSAIFKERQLSPFEVVYSADGIVGQLLGSPLKVSWEGATVLRDFEICLPIETDRVGRYTKYAVAQVTDNVYYLQDAVYTVERDRICLTTSVAGTYAACAVRTEVSNQSIYEYVAAGIFAAGLLYSLFMTVRLVNFVLTQKRESRRRYHLKVFFIGLVNVFLITRVIYFAVQEPGGAIGLLLFEIPNIVFFVLYTTMIYLWLEIITKVKSLKQTNGRIRSVWIAYLCINALMVAVFVVFTILSYTLDDEEQLCARYSAGQSLLRKSELEVQYLIFLCVVSSLITLTVMILGGYFITVLRKSPDSGRQNSKAGSLVKLTLGVMFTFPLFFMTKTALLIASMTIADFAINPIVFALLEVVSVAILILYMMPDKIRFISISVTRTSASTSSSESKKSTKRVSERQINTSSVDTIESD